MQRIPALIRPRSRRCTARRAQSAGPEDQVAWLLAAADDEDFGRRIFGDFEERLCELVCQIVAVLEHGRLDAGRRQALLERIAVSREHLVDLADAVETDLGRCAPSKPTSGWRVAGPARRLLPGTRSGA